MDRFYTEEISIKLKPEATIFARKAEAQRKGNPEDYEKKHKVIAGEGYSFLYIDDLNDVGNGKERQIKGIVKDIKINPKYKIKNVVQSGYSASVRSNMNLSTECGIDRVIIVVDCSEKFRSGIENLKVENILDVHPIDYDYNLEESPRLVPDINDDIDFYEPERWNEIVSEKTPEEISNGRYTY